MVAVPLLAVLLFITLLGIAVMALYLALLLAGCRAGVLFIARLAQTALGKGTPGSFADTLGFFALALLLVMGVASVPFVGALANAALAAFGLGGGALEQVRRRRNSAVSSPHKPDERAMARPAATDAGRA